MWVAEQKYTIICTFEGLIQPPVPTSRLALFWIMLCVLLGINLWQASVTELIYDEAYYWYFSQQPAWGYFDHPPMMAWMIALGRLFFSGTLGVRIVGVLFSAATYLLVWDMISGVKKNHYVPEFFLWMFSITLLNAYGFLILPDTPLLFFTALFLWGVQRLLKKNSWGYAFWVGTAMAAMMYSKYHAVVVIIGVVIGYWPLVRMTKAWVAVLWALLLYTPHLHWLYTHDFVSIGYHLSERPNQPYRFDTFTLGYFINVLAQFGFTLPWVVYAWYKTPKGRFSTVLKSLVFFVLAFFFMSSFTKRIQTQWIVVIAIPTAVLVWELYLRDPKIRRKLGVSAAITTLVLLYARLGLVHESLLPIRYETHGNQAWTSRLKAVVGDSPVVFLDSYRNAPMYAFYQGAISYSLNTMGYRKNQYSIDGSYDQIRGKKVALVAPKNHVFWQTNSPEFSFEKASGDSYHGVWIDRFTYYDQIKASLVQVDSDQAIVELVHPYSYPINAQHIYLSLGVIDDYKRVQQQIPWPLTGEPLPAVWNPRDTLRLVLDKPDILAQEIPGIRLGVGSFHLPAGLQGNPQKRATWNP